MVRRDGHHVALAQGVAHHFIQVLAHIAAGLDLGLGIRGMAKDFVIMTMYHDKFKDLPIAFAPAKVVKPRYWLT